MKVTLMKNLLQLTGTCQLEIPGIKLSNKPEVMHGLRLETGKCWYCSRTLWSRSQTNQSWSRHLSLHGHKNVCTFEFLLIFIQLLFSIFFLVSRPPVLVSGQLVLVSKLRGYFCKVMLMISSTVVA